VVGRPRPRAALPIDWAAFVTEALAGAAANAGGIDTILAGRPGSWEASVVGDALCAKVGRDEWDLWRHRTEPVTVVLNPERILFDNDASNHLLTLNRLGVSIMNPVPAFYTKPKSVDDIVDYIAVRTLDQFGIYEDAPRWEGSCTDLTLRRSSPSNGRSKALLVAEAR
jgi:hypothetical protein